MTAAPIKAEEVRNEAMSRANADRKETIAALWNVLTGMRAKGHHVFSIANVGRNCESLGVLKTQSIRNSTGRDFRKIIEAFALEIGASTTHLKPAKQTPLEEVIEEISDLDARIRLRIELAQGKRSREEVNRLKEAFKHLRVERMLQPDTQIQRADPAELVDVQVLTPLKTVDLTPLTKFLSPDYLRDLGWTVRDDGAIYEGVDRLTPVGFVPSLEGLIELTTDFSSRPSEALPQRALSSSSEPR